MRNNVYYEDSAGRPADTAPGAVFARLLEILVGERGVACFVEACVNAVGTQGDSPILSVAGYLFDSEQAKIFSKEWREALQSAGIRGPFRMYDCVYQHGEFATLTRTQCDQLIGELVGIIKACAMRGVAVAGAAQSMQGAVTDAVNADPVLKSVIGTPYTFCVAYCMAAIDQWVKQHCPAETTVFYFFERGHVNQRETLDFLHWVNQASAFAQQRRYRGSHREWKEDARPLEAAELLAWEWCEFYTESYYATGKPMRESLRGLLEKPHGTLFLSEENVGMRALPLIRSGFLSELLTHRTGKE